MLVNFMLALFMLSEVRRLMVPGVKAAFFFTKIRGSCLRKGKTSNSSKHYDNDDRENILFLYIIPNWLYYCRIQQNSLYCAIVEIIQSIF